VNGRARDCSAGTTLSGLLECLELDPARVAVEYNGAIVTQYTYATTQLADGDRLEIVQFVGRVMPVRGKLCSQGFGATTPRLSGARMAPAKPQGWVHAALGLGGAKPFLTDAKK